MVIKRRPQNVEEFIEEGGKIPSPPPSTEEKSNTPATKRLSPFAIPLALIGGAALLAIRILGRR